MLQPSQHSQARGYIWDFAAYLTIRMRGGVLIDSLAAEWTYAGLVYFCVGAAAAAEVFVVGGVVFRGGGEGLDFGGREAFVLAWAWVAGEGKGD